jgi:hypothetical protein
MDFDIKKFTVKNYIGFDPAKAARLLSNPDRLPVAEIKLGVDDATGELEGWWLPEENDLVVKLLQQHTA